MFPPHKLQFQPGLGTMAHSTRLSSNFSARLSSIFSSRLSTIFSARFSRLPSALAGLAAGSTTLTTTACATLDLFRDDAAALATAHGTTLAGTSFGAARLVLFRLATTGMATIGNLALVGTALAASGWLADSSSGSAIITASCGHGQAGCKGRRMVEGSRCFMQKTVNISVDLSIKAKIVSDTLAKGKVSVGNNGERRLTSFRSCSSKVP
jgi:hypothetical protein